MLENTPTLETREERPPNILNRTAEAIRRKIAEAGSIRGLTQQVAKEFSQFVKEIFNVRETVKDLGEDIGAVLPELKGIKESANRIAHPEEARETERRLEQAEAISKKWRGIINLATKAFANYGPEIGSSSSYEVSIIKDGDEKPEKTSFVQMTEKGGNNLVKIFDNEGDTLTQVAEIKIKKYGHGPEGIPIPDPRSGVERAEFGDNNEITFSLEKEVYDALDMTVETEYTQSLTPEGNAAIAVVRIDINRRDSDGGLKTLKLRYYPEVVATQNKKANEQVFTNGTGIEIGQPQFEETEDGMRLTLKVESDEVTETISLNLRTMSLEEQAEMITDFEEKAGILHNFQT